MGIILLIVALTFASGELYVRVRLDHKTAHPPQIKDGFALGLVFRLPPHIGHLPSPGLLGPSEGAATKERVWPNFQRASRPLPVVKHPLYKVALLGCSWTYGLGAADVDTYAWQLNERYPNILFDNYGVPMYGSHLTYLRLRDTITQGKHYDLYIYGFMYDHLYRDLLDKWYTLEPSNTVYVFPGEELHYPDKVLCRRRSHWYGEDLSALVHFFHLRYACFMEQAPVMAERRRLWSELEPNRQAFRENVMAMRKLVESNGGKYAMVALMLKSKFLYEQELAELNIPTAFALQRPGDVKTCLNCGPASHPNRLGHEKIAEAVTALLKRQQLPAQAMVSCGEP